MHHVGGVCVCSDGGGYRQRVILFVIVCVYTCAYVCVSISNAEKEEGRTEMEVGIISLTGIKPPNITETINFSNNNNKN